MTIVNGYICLPEMDGKPSFGYDMDHVVPRWGETYSVYDDADLYSFGFRVALYPHIAIYHQRETERFYLAQVQASGEIVQEIFGDFSLYFASRIEIMSPVVGIFTPQFNRWWYEFVQANELEYADFWQVCTRELNSDIDRIVIPYMQYVTKMN